jgi:hypothetical protein
MLRVEDDLHQPRAISEVAEDQAAMISAAVKPALEANALTDICGANGAARMSSSHGSIISAVLLGVGHGSCVRVT